MPDFSAQESALGYLYQARYALWLLLNGPEEQEVVLETVDDIVLGQDGTPRDLLQTKHNSVPARLTDASSQLWKTLRVWSTHVKDGLIRVPPTTLTLITTAQAPVGSIASVLRPDRGRDCATFWTIHPTSRIRATRFGIEFAALSIDRTGMRCLKDSKAGGSARSSTN